MYPILPFHVGFDGAVAYPIVRRSCKWVVYNYLVTVHAEHAVFPIELDRSLAYTIYCGLDRDVKQKAPLVAAACALILAVGKFSAGLVSGSMALVSSGLDSLLDVFMSTMNFFAIQKAAKPADEDHRYGHRQGGGSGGASPVFPSSCSAAV